MNISESTVMLEISESWYTCFRRVLLNFIAEKQMQVVRFFHGKFNVVEFGV